jgi:hypothetical protein
LFFGATTGMMTMTVAAMVVAVVGMAISQRGTEERERRATHNNQLKDDNAAYDNKAAYNKDVHNDNATYNNDVASRIVIRRTPHN